MKRRTYLAQTGLLSGLAGCLGRFPGNQDESTTTDQEGAANTTLPADPASQDGYPPPFEDVPAQRLIDI